MKVLHVLASDSTSWGGPPRVVRDLTGELGRLGVENVVVALSSRDSPPIKFSNNTTLVECGIAAIPKLAIPASMNLVQKLVREIGAADLVHIHELWHLPHLVGALISRVMDVPYIVSPHGELQPWPLTRHRLLKRIAWLSYEKQILADCLGIHTLTSLEKGAVTALCPGIPLVVIPNGLDVRQIDRDLEVVPSLRAVHGRLTQPYLLFVGRLAPEKGLDLLLDAFSIVHRARREMSLVLAGPDEFGLWGALKERARDLGIAQRVIYLGTVNEPNKYRLFASAHAFLLPSISEGLSVSLLEALACGTPAIITTACNLPEVETAGAGRVVEPIPELFARAVQDTLQDGTAREKMKANARQLVSSRFSIRSMATKMLVFYDEVLARQSSPFSGGGIAAAIGNN